MSNQGILLDHDPKARRDADFYETPRWQVRALLRRLRLRTSTVIIEPCAGKNAIVDLLRELGHRVWANDIVQHGSARLDSRLDATDPMSWIQMVDLCETHFGEAPQLALTNVPFDISFPIVRCGRETMPIFASILRRTWDEPTKDRGDWHAKYPSSSQIVLPRWNYKENRVNGSSDSTTTAWFMWAKHGRPTDRALDYVSWAERDELMALDARRI